MLEAVLQNWISGGLKTSAVVFKSERWNKYETISFFEGLNFFRVQDGKHYVPEFEAFAALLVVRRRVATKLLREMEQILKRAESLIKSNPERTSIPFAEFAEALSNPVDLGDALTLLDLSGIGLHYNGNQLYPSVQLTEQLRRNGKSFLGFVDVKIEQQTRQPVGFAASFPSLNSRHASFPAADVTRLQRVPDADAQATKAIDQLLRDPSAAISSAKSSLEATLKWIIDTEGGDMPKKVSMPDLLKRCKALVPSMADPTYLMGRAVTSLVTEIASARNLFS